MTAFRLLRRIVYLLLDLLILLLIIRMALRLAGAGAAGFTSLIYAWSAPFVAPFSGMFPAARASGSVLEWSTLIAMLAYALAAYVIVRVLRVLLVPPVRETTIIEDTEEDFHE
jgi:YggT family protein